MSRVKTVYLFMLAALLVLSACNLPVTPQAKGAAPGIVVVSVSAASEYRAGPGSDYAAVGMLQPGQMVEAVGRSPDGAYLLIRDPANPALLWWLNGEFVTITMGNPLGLPISTPVLAPTSVAGAGGCPTPVGGGPTPVSCPTLVGGSSGSGCPTPVGGGPTPVSCVTPVAGSGCPTPVGGGPTPVSCSKPSGSGCPTPVGGGPTPVSCSKKPASGSSSGSGCPTPVGGGPTPVSCGKPTRRGGPTPVPTPVK